ncbi:MAG: DUF222 domain-containing protein [Acidimicrobiales bacterium]
MLEGLVADLDELCEADPSALGDGEAIQVLHRCVARLEAVTTRATAAFDAGGDWAEDGARSAAGWITARCRVPEGTARKAVRLGRALRHLPATEATWVGGDIGEAQVTSLVAARTTATGESMDLHEQMLVGQAATLTYKHFVRVLDYWHQHADPDGADDDAAARKAQRSFRLSESLGGMWFGDLTLDPVGGAIVVNQLSRIEDELFAADWAEAKERFGEHLSFTTSDLARTSAQRRADALAEMAIRSATAPAHGRRPEPLFSVFVDFETFAGRIGEMANGAVVSPASFVDHLDTAWVERVVFDGASRVMDLGPATRLFAGATRRAIQLRDRECFHPLCDVRASRCEVDHIEPWAAGGRTIQRNGRLACGFHNRARHRKRRRKPSPPP